MFVAGPSVQGGVISEHPSLKNLDLLGDLKNGIDFRRVYDTLLGVKSEDVLVGKWEHLDLLKPKA
jgi:uncharacterized protein (DUF1501 family)